MDFAKFMSSGMGRGLRIVAGLALIVIGLFSVGGTGGVILAVVGAVPLLAGIFDVCLFAPLFGGPLKGSESDRLSDQDHRHPAGHPLSLDDQDLAHK